MVEARELLWYHLEPVLKEKVSKKRRPAPPVDTVSARPFVEDICQWVLQLVNDDQYDDAPVKFYALNLRNTPPCKPEEINVFSLAARITELEEKFRERESTISQTAHVPPVSLPPLGRDSGDPSLAALVDSSGQLASALRTVSSGLNPDADSWATIAKKPVPRRQRSGWRQQLREATNKLQVVVGNKKAEAKLRGSKPLKQLFVYGLDGSCEADDIQDFLVNNEVQPKQIHRVSKENWSRASFRITDKEQSVGRMLCPDFWPDKVRCREWVRFAPEKRSDDSADAAPDALPSSDSTTLKYGEER